MGTLLQVTASGPDPHALARALDAAIAAVEQVERLMSFHAGDSELAMLNRHASREPVTVHPWTYAVLRRAVHIAALSGGMFDVAVAPVLVKLGMLPPSEAGASRGGNCLAI